MKKLISIILLAIVCLSVPLTASAVKIPATCFDWEKTDFTTNAFTEIWISNCPTYTTDDPNIFTFQTSTVLTQHGIDSLPEIPKNTYREIVGFVYNKATNSWQIFATQYYDRNEQKIRSDIYLLNGNINPDSWIPLGNNTGGLINNYINMLKNRPPCGKCTGK
jgi:hypothetical protein